MGGYGRPHRVEVGKVDHGQRDPQQESAAVVLWPGAMWCGRPLARTTGLRSTAVAGAGLTFIGPPGDVHRRMGDKKGARRLMAAAGVPVVPGSEGVVETVDAAREAAARVGYPVFLKAAAGGGGIGMARVADESALARIGERWELTRRSHDEAPDRRPTLVLTGRQDSTVGYARAWELLEHYPRATFRRAGPGGTCASARAALAAPRTRHRMARPRG